tara:strand:+ start:108 stop:281 length:174 start_codon:yes stop_codon:yes gene_type:complete
MKKIIYFIFLFLYSCSTNPSLNEKKISIDFEKKMSIEEFKIKLEEYANNSSYPSIDN